jgi:hypothetical protein
MCQKRKVAEAVYEAPHPIKLGSNSALQAAYREMKRGAKRIALFGVDLRDDELTHHYGLHPWGQRMNPTRPRFNRARRAWGDFAALSGRPEVVNCSARSALECFPKMEAERGLSLS